jgi:hypothetical protein
MRKQQERDVEPVGKLEVVQSGSAERGRQNIGCMGLLAASMKLAASGQPPGCL